MRGYGLRVYATLQEASVSTYEEADAMFQVPEPASPVARAVCIVKGPQTLPLPAHLYTIRQHTSAYVSIPQHTSTYVSIRQHT
jgi:hypothetical protein